MTSQNDSKDFFVSAPLLLAILKSKEVLEKLGSDGVVINVPELKQFFKSECAS